MSPKVFISHSAKDGAVQQVLWEIYHTLADDGYEPLLDLARLRENVGSPWRATLNTWMELCDGAIVLVDKRARDVSKWVPHEAGILSWRRHRDSDFVLIPIVISPVLPEDLGKEAFEPANLAALQTEVISLETQPEYLATVKERMAPLKELEAAQTPIGMMNIALPLCLAMSMKSPFTGLRNHWEKTCEAGIPTSCVPWLWLGSS
jgi:hypothetical protein